jgi:hypothetical protein
MRRVEVRLLVLFATVVMPGCSSSNTPQRPTDEAEKDHKVSEKASDSSRVGKEKPDETPRPTDKPAPPLQLAAPAPLAEKLDGKVLKTMAAGELIGRANQAMGKADYTRAATYQYWYVLKTKSGQYNLACFLAQIGQTDPAFYFLQQAAIEEGVDTEHAERDEDLASLRNDPRWAKVHRYLADCNRHFETAPIGRTTLIVPKERRSQPSCGCMALALVLKISSTRAARSMPTI